MSDLKEKAKTRKEIIDLRELEKQQYEKDLEKAEGAIEIKSLHAKFCQKDNQEWVGLKDAEVPEKKLEELKQKLQSLQFLEELALLEHNQWSEWLEYMNKRAIHGETIVEFTNGTWNEWLRKASFHYCDLTEQEKESDRKLAKKVLEKFELLLKEEKEAKPK